MKKYLFLLLLAFGTVKIFAQATAPSNQYAVAANPNDSFNFLGKTVPHYGLGWYSEADNLPPTAYLSSFSGLRIFSEGIPKINMNRFGNVGFGITEPTSKIHIAGDEFITMGNYENSNNAKGIHFTGFRDVQPAYFGASIEAVPEWVCCGGYPSAGYPGIKNIGLTFNVHDNVDIAGSKKLAMAIKSSGYVGLGTANPEAQLDLVGKLGIRAADGGHRTEIGNDGGHTENSQAFYINNSAGSSLLSVNYGGNIGIGTVSPKDKLSVNGRVRALEVKVESANWPDYVFSKDYQILALKDVEHYINENRHLPGIPDAKTVAENGIALGEMNRKLLEKIEELTLHLIDQQKQLVKQQEKIGELQTAVEALAKRNK